MSDVIGVLRWLEQQAAHNQSFGHHCMAYETAADKLATALGEQVAALPGKLRVINRAPCPNCRGGYIHGPRGGRNRCPACIGAGEVFTKGCEVCGAEYSYRSAGFAEVRCTKCPPNPAAERTKSDSQAQPSIEQPYQSKIPTQPQGEGDAS